jgi:signal transduction histidine kinase
MSARADVPSWQRWLFPGEFLAAPGGPRSARDWAVDVVAFGFAVVVGIFVLAETWHEHSSALRVIDIVLGVASWVALWWRRRHPLAVVVLALVASALSGLAAGAVLIALFNAAVRVPLRAVAAVLAVGLPGGALYAALYPNGTTFDWVGLVIGVLLSVVAISWGLLVRARRALILSLRERAERLESEQRLRVEQARDAERRRIAREMHDVLAHRVSLLSLHAGALEFRPDAPPDEIAEAAGVIRATARSALEDLRDVIGVLRDEPGEGVEPPQPTLAQIPALVDESRAAGTQVNCRIELDDGEPPEALGRTAYRIVQEGLTNARKHAPAAAVDVAVTRARKDALVVQVANRRPLGASAAALPGAGTGLIGLAERVALAGGELEHGPRPDGDFVLRATLPWTA